MTYLTPSFKQCRGYVSANLHSQLATPQYSRKRPPSLTISRLTGARGHTIAGKLIKTLRAKDTEAPVPWTLFDQDLVHKILEDNNLPTDIEKFMPDDAVGELEGTINEILGRHPSLWTLFEKTVSTITRLSRAGNCIIVGRGANHISAGFPNVVRVRLIGSEAKRVAHIRKTHKVSETEAKKYIKEEDNARRRFVKQHFHSNISDPSFYDLVINTDFLNDDVIVEMLACALESKRK